MDYRLASLSDCAQLAECRWALWLEDGQDSAKLDKESFVHQFVEWLAPRLGESWFVWCAIADERVISHVYIHKVEKLPKPSAPLDQFGYVTSVYTRPERRGEGIGSELVSKVRSWALAADLEFLILWPSEESVPFWRRAAFQETEALAREIRPYVN